MVTEAIKKLQDHQDEQMERVLQTLSQRVEGMRGYLDATVATIGGVSTQILSVETVKTRQLEEQIRSLQEENAKLVFDRNENAKRFEEAETARIKLEQAITEKDILLVKASGENAALQITSHHQEDAIVALKLAVEAKESRCVDLEKWKDECHSLMSSLDETKRRLTAQEESNLSEIKLLQEKLDDAAAALRREINEREAHLASMSQQVQQLKDTLDATSADAQLLAKKLLTSEAERAELGKVVASQEEEIAQLKAQTKPLLQQPPQPLQQAHKKMSLDAARHLRRCAAPSGEQEHKLEELEIISNALKAKKGTDLPGDTK